MGFFDSINQAFYNWQNQLLQNIYAFSNHDYVTPEDHEEDDEDEWEWTTTVVVGEPLRKTKCLFVPEMNDFYTDQELNTIYHTADEYRNALKKYGLVYKSQQFPNADTTQKLLDYATDWIKNNYHGGIKNFSVTALDMHLMGADVDKYVVGQRTPVIYMDPLLHREETETLTVISAEYDLQSPERNSYKIGIPDVTLNKVYGETSKSGGGGGGGGKSSDETDNETDTEVEQIEDDAETQRRNLMEFMWAMIFKGTRNGDEAYDISELIPPSEKDKTGNFLYGVMADILNASQVKSVIGDFTSSLTGGYIKSRGGLDAETVSANKGNVTNVNSEKIKNTDSIESKDITASNDISATETVSGKNLEATNNVSATETVSGKNLEATNNVSATETVSGKNVSASNNVTATEKVSGKNLEATNSVSAKETVSGKNVTASNNVTATNKVTGKTVEASDGVSAVNGSFSKSLKLGGKTVAVVDDIPSLPGTVTVTINDKQYKLYGSLVSS